MSRLRLPRLLLAAAALLGLLCLPAAASARPASGVQLPPVRANLTPSGITQALDTAAKVRSRIIRLEVDWSLLEPRRQGEYDPAFLANLDRVVDGAAKRKIKVLIFVNRSPCWASSAPDKGSCAAADANRFDVTRYGPTDPQDYVPVSTFLAARYGSKLGAFEVWNEPDQANEKYWAGPDKVRRYVALMKAVYGPLKKVNPKLPVIAGSFVGTNGAWLKAMYAEGAKGHYDGLAVHFYDLPLYGLRETRKVQRANGDRKPLWLSEFGWTSCLRKRGPSHMADHPCVTKAMQGKALSDVFRAVSRTSWVKAAIVYTLQDESTAYQFGVVDRAGKRKPAFTTVRRTLGAKRLKPLPRPTARLRTSRGQLVVSGAASITDVYVVRAFYGSQLLFRGYVRTDQRGRYRLTLPKVLGTRGLRVRVSSAWSGASVTRRSQP